MFLTHPCDGLGNCAVTSSKHAHAHENNTTGKVTNVFFFGLFVPLLLRGRTDVNFMPKALALCFFNCRGFVILMALFFESPSLSEWGLGEQAVDLPSTNCQIVTRKKISRLPFALCMTQNYVVLNST